MKSRNLQFISNDQDYVAENTLRATVFTTPSTEHVYRRGVSRLINDRDNDKDDETMELRHVSPPPTPLLLSSGSPDRIFADTNISPLSSTSLGENINTPHFRRTFRSYSSRSSINQASYSRLNETLQHDKPTTPVYRTFAQCGKRKFIDMCIDEQRSTAALEKKAQPLEKVTGHSCQHYSDSIGHDDLSEDVQWSPSLETPERPSANGTNSVSPGSIMQNLRDNAAEKMREFGAGPSDSPSERDPIGSENGHSNIMKWPYSLLSELEDDEARQTSFEIGDVNLAQQNTSRTVPLSDIDIPNQKQKVLKNSLFDRASDLRLSCHISSSPFQGNLDFERSYSQSEYPGSPSLRKGNQEGVHDGCGSKGEHEKSPKPFSSLVNMPILLYPETSPTASSISGPWPQSLVHHKRIRNDMTTGNSFPFELSYFKFLF